MDFNQAMEVIDSDDDLTLSQIDSSLLDNTISAEVLTNIQTCDVKKSEKVELSSEKKDEVITNDNTISAEVLTNSETCDVKKSEKLEPSSEKKDEVITIHSTISA